MKNGVFPCKRDAVMTQGTPWRRAAVASDAQLRSSWSTAGVVIPRMCAG